MAVSPPETHHPAHKATPSVPWLPLLLTALGVGLRLRQFLFNRSLWLDEALLANNVVQRELSPLLAEPLASNQGAPLGFLLVSDLLSHLPLPTDLALRIGPLLAGLAALALAYRLSLDVLTTPAARATFVGPMALAPVLVYYSSEFKQYAGDVAVALAILWIGVRYRPDLRSAALLAAAGAVGLWFSHPALFMAAAVGIGLAAEAAWRRQWRDLRPLAAVAVVWAVNLGLVYALSLRDLAGNRNLVAYWRLGYAPVLVSGPAELRWYWDSALGFVFLAFGEAGPVGAAPQPEWFGPLNIALLAVVAAGAVYLARRQPRLATFALLAVGLTVFASGLKLYPFRGRLILFLTPLAFLAAAGSVEWLAAGRRRWRPAAAWALAAALLTVVAVPSARVALHPYNHFDIKSALRFVQAQRGPGDAVALTFWTEPAYRFYAPAFGLHDLPVAAIAPRDNDPAALLAALCDHPPLRPTWLVVSHRFDERLDLLAALGEKGPMTASWEGNGAGAYRFDLSQAGPACP
ncbi:MAG: hypothetical protein NZ528_13125 [Caldilineales bacterium]|nr:hypothetical protein [Caldilineales bacterium]